MLKSGTRPFIRNARDGTSEPSGPMIPEPQAIHPRLSCLKTIRPAYLGYIRPKMADNVLQVASAQVLRCERCSTQYPLTHEGRTCDNDGGKLILADGDPLVGCVVAGRYAIESMLGVGGWSVVYLARDRQLNNRQIAIKILHYHLLRDELSIKRFQQEAVTAASLSHPHIAMMFDSGVMPNGQPFIAMEYIEGSTLEMLVGFEGQLSTQRTIEILCQLCEAMSYAHRQNLIHRDLKPSNVLLLDSGFVKVVDFGLAKCLDGLECLTATGQTLGTPAYMSPEQCRGQALDARSDVYCLGLIASFMLTGQQLFKAETNVEAMHKQLTERAKTPSELRPDLYFLPALEEIIMRCLDKNAADRFQNCIELQTALRAVLQKDARAARASSAIATDSTIAACAAIAVLVFAIGAGIWIAQTRPAPTPPAVERTPVQSASATSFVAANATVRKSTSPVIAPLPTAATPNLPATTVDSDVQATSKPQSNTPPPIAPDIVRATKAPATADNVAYSIHSKASSTNIESGALLPEESGALRPGQLPTPGTKPIIIADKVSSNDEAFVRLASIADCNVLNLPDSNIDDQVLEYAINHFPSLRRVGLARTRITDKGLNMIASSKIMVAYLRRLPITDGGLGNLQHAPNLRYLDLTANCISDIGIRNLCNTSLTVLVLNLTKITDGSCDYLGKMIGLQSLALGGTQIGDMGIRKLASLPHLAELNCWHTNITDESMREFANMPLESLGVSDTAITDDGIAALSKSTTLRRLDISNTAVTPAAVQSILRMKNLDILRPNAALNQASETFRNAGIIVVDTDDQIYAWALKAPGS